MAVSVHTVSQCSVALGVQGNKQGKVHRRCNAKNTSPIKTGLVFTSPSLPNSSSAYTVAAGSADTPSCRYGKDPTFSPPGCLREDQPIGRAREHSGETNSKVLLQAFISKSVLS